MCGSSKVQSISNQGISLYQFSCILVSFVICIPFLSFSSIHQISFFVRCPIKSSFFFVCFLFTSYISICIYKYMCIYIPLFLHIKAMIDLDRESWLTQSLFSFFVSFKYYNNYYLIQIKYLTICFSFSCADQH